MVCVKYALLDRRNFHDAPNLTGMLPAGWFFLENSSGTPTKVGDIHEHFLDILDRLGEDSWAIICKLSDRETSIGAFETYLFKKEIEL
jgi:hypothetical protein